MATDPAPDTTLGRGLVIRALVAATAVAIFLVTRDTLSPRALVATRFGIGVALFALLVDVGRTLVGASDPVSGDLSPHQQRADPLVDERYERVHEPVKRFLDEGVFTDAYAEIVEEACQADAVPDAERERVLEQAREAARADRPSGPPLPGALAAGLVITVGLALAIGTLLEALTLPVTGPVLIVAGVGLSLMQLRAHDANARWVALGLGVVGAIVVTAAGLRLAARYAGPWWLVIALAVLMLLATLALFFLGDATPPAWARVERELTRRFAMLRRAFLAALLAGGVLFPFKPLLEELFLAMTWPFETPYRMATIVYGSVAAYLAAEMAATWFGLAQGQERAREQRRRRVEANEAVLALLDEHTPRSKTTGGARA